MATIEQTAHDTSQALGRAAQSAGASLREKGRDIEGQEYGFRQGQRSEDSLTTQIENVTTRVPSSTFLGLALGSIAVSAVLRALGNKNDAQFVGQWVPTILILGLYNKMVKLNSSENRQAH